jgi:hypothetical protein
MSKIERYGKVVPFVNGKWKREVNVALEIDFMKITPYIVREWFAEPISVHSATSTSLILVDFVEFRRGMTSVDFYDAAVVPSTTWIRQVCLTLLQLNEEESETVVKQFLSYCGSISQWE